MQEQIYNWLTTGLQQPEDLLREIFYYDKRDNEFFSILVADYFIFDKNLNVAKDTTTSYTKENLETLIDRMRRIERGHYNYFFAKTRQYTKYHRNKIHFSANKHVFEFELHQH